LSLGRKITSSLIRPEQLLWDNVFSIQTPSNAMNRLLEWSQQYARFLKALLSTSLDQLHTGLAAPGWHLEEQTK